MRIANNIMAMNTHRSYTNNNDKVSQSAEKLSSGYRINKAGDDAAGLAISEKMRSQIRGLGMATRNSQDAISLIQTAEGALQEVHSMLQRMNELAVQSATGTNEEFDRTQISKEFDQLKREINDIAEQTTFNNMKLLDGSLSNEGTQRSAATTGILVNESQVISGASMKPALSGAGTDVVVAETGTATAAAGTFGIVAGTSTDTGATVSLEIGGVTFTGSATHDFTGGDVDNAAMATMFNGVTSGDYTLTVAADGAMTITQTVDGTGDMSKFDGATATLSTDATNIGAVTNSTSAAGVTQEGAAAAAADPRKNTLTFEGTPKAGDLFSFNGQNYQFVDDAAAEVADGVEKVVVGATKSASIDALAAAMTANDAGGVYTIASANGGMTIEQATPGTGDVQATYTAAKQTNSTVEFDIGKLKTGDQVQVTTVNQETGVEQTLTYVHNEGATMDNIEEALSGLGGERKGNTLFFENTKATVELTAAAAIEPEGSMRIQVGALENEQVNVEIKAMNTAGLGLDDHNISDQDSAGNAITAVRDAVNQVSDQRALLGAMQNRMTHKINNLKVSSENLSAAESRIRDVDIASEMTTFTKNNILSQAATAMLAQANSAPQNVLSLLR